MFNGKAHAMGPRDEVLAKLFGPPQGAPGARLLPRLRQPPGPEGVGLRLVGEGGGTSS